MQLSHLKTHDKEMYSLIKGEEKRQKEGLELIPSENYVSLSVSEAVGSVLENKYAEGYPKKRYYTGNAYVDPMEDLVRERAKKLFGVPFVNVQPLSGGPANLEISAALFEDGDVALSQELSHGGHLSMGQKASYTSKWFHTEFYHLTPDGEINFEELAELARRLKPKIIWAGGTAYTKVFKWEKYAEIADEVGAYFIADISHIGGLVAGKAHPSPAPYAHLIMTTTHKTLRGPRGAIIMVTDKGIKKNPELPKKIDYAVFPGLQGGPHENKIAGIGVALREAQGKPFQTYSAQIVKNAKTIAEELKKYEFDLIGGGSENHMVWINLQNKKIDGWMAHVTLEMACMYGNKQTIPFDPKSPFFPSGYRLGTPALTTRGMKEKEMKRVAAFINRGVELCRKYAVDGILSEDKETAKAARASYLKKVAKSKELLQLRKEVIAFAKKFPVPIEAKK